MDNRKVDILNKIVKISIFIFILLDIFSYFLYNFFTPKDLELNNKYAYIYYPLLCSVSQAYVTFMLVLISYKLKLDFSTRLISIAYLSIIVIQLISILFNAYVTHFAYFSLTMTFIIIAIFYLKKWK